MQIRALKSLFCGERCLWTITIGIILFDRHTIASSNSFLRSYHTPSGRYYMDVSRPGDVQTKKLYGVVGDDGKSNDVIFCGHFVPAQSNVVFFGGDVQDYVENMRSHRDNKAFEKWNLETTAQLLSSRFPACHIWVVKPSVMELKTFSVYKNFLIWADISKPVFKSGQNSWRHLEKILNSSVERMNTDYETVNRDTICSSSDSCRTFNSHLPLTVIGFSKGCVVLNQLLYDMETSEEHDFISRVKNMFWLDGGHNGGSNVWITDVKVLKCLVESGIEVEVHVTPYQIKDPLRPWIGREYKQFLALFRKLNGKVKDVVHFADEDRSIENHFNVLLRF